MKDPRMQTDADDVWPGRSCPVIGTLLAFLLLWTVFSSERLAGFIGMENGIAC